MHSRATIKVKLEFARLSFEMLALPCLDLYCKIRPSQLCYLGSSVGRALGLESRVSWVRVPPEKSLPQVSLNCAVLLEGVLKFMY